MADVGPNGEFDWPVMGPELSGFSFGTTTEPTTFVYGRKVWEMMSSFWPEAESMSDDPHDLKFAPIWRESPKVVVSNTLKEAGWNTTIVSGDIAARLTELKRQPGGDLQINGGAELAASLTELGLIDEYHVVVHPVLLGGGRRLYEEGKQRRPMELLESRVFDGQTVLLRYAPTTAPDTAPADTAPDTAPADTAPDTAPADTAPAED